MSSLANPQPSWPGRSRQEISSVEAVEAHLHRIEAVNPRSTRLSGYSPTEARWHDACRPGGCARRPPRPLHGVPFTVKGEYRRRRTVHNLGRAGAFRRGGFRWMRPSCSSACARPVRFLSGAPTCPTWLRRHHRQLATRHHATRGTRCARPQAPAAVGGGRPATGMSPIGLATTLVARRNPGQCVRYRFDSALGGSGSLTPALSPGKTT